MIVYVGVHSAIQENLPEDPSSFSFLSRVIVQGVT